RLLAEEVVAGLHGRGQLPHFARVHDTRGFAEGLLTLLVDLKRNDVGPGAFARAAYRRGPAGGEAGRKIGARAIARKARQFARIYARYERELRRQNLQDLEGRPARAVDLLRRGAALPTAGVRAVFLDDFTDFTRAQHDLLEILCGRVEEL